MKTRSKMVIALIMVLFGLFLLGFGVTEMPDSENKMVNLVAIAAGILLLSTFLTYGMKLASFPEQSDDNS